MVAVEEIRRLRNASARLSRTRRRSAGRGPS
jgi:hypothetical protein